MASVCPTPGSRPWATRSVGRATRLRQGDVRHPAATPTRLFHEGVRRRPPMGGGELCGYLTDTRLLEVVRRSPGDLDGGHLRGECCARHAGRPAAAAPSSASADRRPHWYDALLG